MAFGIWMVVFMGMGWNGMGWVGLGSNGSLELDAGGTNGFQMSQVGPTASAEDAEVGQFGLEQSILTAELGRIAGVQVGAGVEFRMASAGGVGTESVDTLQPRGAGLERMPEVGGMGAVDHVVGWWPVGLLVDGRDDIAEWLAGRQVPVGFDREGDDGRDVELCGGVGDAEGLFEVVHGDGGDQVGSGVAAGQDLGTMIGGGGGYGHEREGLITVAARPETTADDHGTAWPFEFSADFVHEPDGIAIGLDELAWGVSEPTGPVGIGAPGGAFEDQPHSMSERESGVRAEVMAENGASGGRPEQIERGEMGQVDSFEEDQGGLETAVGNVDGVGVKRQPGVLVHGSHMVFPHGREGRPHIVRGADGAESVPAG
jgi:hypothetical protein